MEYPTQTQSHDCHQDRPEPVIMEEDIIHVLILNESAACRYVSMTRHFKTSMSETGFGDLTEKAEHVPTHSPTKFQAPH